MKKIALFLMMLLPLGAIAQKQQDMSKYLAGAVPTQNGIVIFEKSFEVPGKNKAEIYEGLKTYFAENIKDYLSKFDLWTREHWKLLQL